MVEVYERRSTGRWDRRCSFGPASLGWGGYLPAINPSVSWRASSSVYCLGGVFMK